MTIRKCLVLASLVYLLSTAANAEDWPQWRGKKRDGISTEKNLLKQWSKSGPKLLWQIKDAGYGFGSVAIAGERVFLVGSRGLEEEFVSALDARTGRLIWSTKIGKPGNPDQQPSYPGARSTPTVDGNFVYALGSDGDLACLEAVNGAIKWKRSLRTDFGGKPGTWAYSESPLVDQERVVVAPGSEQAGLVALDKRNGELIWKTPIPGEKQAGYSSTIVAEIGGVRQYVHYLLKGLAGVEAKTGKFLWRYDRSIDTRFQVHAATPITHNNTVYSAAAMGGGLALIKSDGGTFTADSVYSTRKLPNALGGAIKIGDYLYGTTSVSLLCLEYATGKVRWEDRSVGAASLCYADGRLYVRGENGEVALVEATPEAYRELGRFTPADAPARGETRAWCYPAVANGRLYIRDLGTLWVYDIRNNSSR
jgi:outer membrane protein assembly factor BamB